MKVTYTHEEMMELLGEHIRTMFRQYDITSITYDKWSGLEIEGERKPLPKPTDNMDFSGVYPANNSPEEAPKPPSPPPSTDYRPKSEKDDDIPF